MINRDGRKDAKYPLSFSNQGKRFHEKAIEAQQQESSENNPTLRSEGYTASHEQSKANVPSLSIRQTLNAAWRGWNWKNFYLNVFGIERDSEEE